MALFTRTAKLDPGAHSARCAWAMAIHHAVGINCQRNSGYRPSRVKVAQNLSTPDPPLSPTQLSIRRGRTTTTHYTRHQPDGVVQHYTSPFPGVAHWASLWSRPQRWHVCHPEYETNKERKKEDPQKLPSVVHKATCQKQRTITMHLVTLATTSQPIITPRYPNRLCRTTWPTRNLTWGGRGLRGSAEPRFTMTLRTNIDKQTFPHNNNNNNNNNKWPVSFKQTSRFHLSITNLKPVTPNITSQFSKQNQSLVYTSSLTTQTQIPGGPESGPHYFIAYMFKTPALISTIFGT